MDTIIFQTIHGLVGSSQVVDYIGIFFAKYLAFVLVGILVALGLQRGERGIRNRKILWEALGAAIVSRFIIVELIRIWIERARPFVAESFEALVSIDIDEYYGSFPSGHASFFFALATTVWLHNRRLGTYFFIGSFIMGIGRIFVGVHWPSDILGGAIVGILSSLTVHWLSRKLSSAPPASKENLS